MFSCDAFSHSGAKCVGWRCIFINPVRSQQLCLVLMSQGGAFILSPIKMALRVNQFQQCET